MSRFLRRAAAAEYLQSQYGQGTAGTLAKLACIGGGPPFRRLGRFPVYLREDLDAWIASRLSQRMNNTAATGKQGVA